MGLPEHLRTPDSLERDPSDSRLQLCFTFWVVEMNCGVEGLCRIKFPARQVGAGRVSLARVEVISEGCGPLELGGGSTQSSPGHYSEGSCCHPLV